MAMDLTRASWRKARASGPNGQCVEVADLGRQVAVRDSKDTAGAALVVSRDAWRRFVGTAAAGGFDRRG